MAFNVEAFIREGWSKDVPLRNQTQQREGDAELAVMFYGGDYKLVFDPRDPAQVAEAKRSFERLKEKGFLCFKMAEDSDERGEQIKEFDGSAGRYIMAPPVRGG